MATTSAFVKRLNDLMRGYLIEAEAGRREAIVTAAKRDPNKHATCLVFPGGIRWIYWTPVWRSKHVRVRWCYTTTRNAAGRFLVFREVAKFKTVKENGRARKVRVSGRRDSFRAFVSRASACEQAKRAARAEQAKQAEKAARA